MNRAYSLMALRALQYFMLLKTMKVTMSTSIFFPNMTMEEPIDMMQASAIMPGLHGTNSFNPMIGLVKLSVSVIDEINNPTEATVQQGFIPSSPQD